MTRLLVALILLAAPAALPMLAFVGARPESLALLLPAGALLCATAATAAVATASPVLPWFVAVVVVVNAAAGVWLRRQVVRRRREARRPAEVGEGPRQVEARRPIRLAFAAAVAAAAVGLIPLVRPELGWDARSIWLLHARLLRSGGAAYVAAFGNPAYAFSHLGYPLLAPGAVWSGWLGVGHIDYRLSQIVIALLGASLTVAAGCLLARVPNPLRARVLPAVVVTGFVLGTYGIAGPMATNGYTDLIAAAAAVAGAIALLLLPADQPTVAIGVLCCWIAGSTKNEGLVAALVIAALAVVRRYAADRRRGPSLLVGAVIAGPLLIWPAAAVARGLQSLDGTPDQPVSQSLGTRLSATLSALYDAMPHLVLLVVLIALSAVLFRRRRAGLGLGSGWYLWATAGAYLAALVVTYVHGRWEIHWWLGTSASRVTIMPRMVLLADICVWIFVSAGAVRELLAARAQDEHGQHEVVETAAAR